MRTRILIGVILTLSLAAHCAITTAVPAAQVAHRTAGEAPEGQATGPFTITVKTPPTAIMQGEPLLSGATLR